MDDSFALLGLSQCNTNVVLILLYSIDTCVQLTFEMETEQRLAYPDVLIIRHASEFLTTVYRKPGCLPCG